MNNTHADTQPAILLSPAGVAVVASDLLQQEVLERRLSAGGWDSLSEASQEQLTTWARQLMTAYVDGPAGEGELRVATELWRLVAGGSNGLLDDRREEYLRRARQLVAHYKEATHWLPPWPIECARERLRRATRDGHD